MLLCEFASHEFVDERLDDVVRGQPHPGSVPDHAALRAPPDHAAQRALPNRADRLRHSVRMRRVPPSVQTRRVYPPAAQGLLVLPPRLTDSAKRIAAAAEARGLSTFQCETFEVPREVAAATTPRFLHAGPSFADAVAKDLEIAPLEAPPDWLVTLPHEFTRRDITSMTLHEAYQLRTPAFIKTPNDKQVAARIYPDGTRLPGPDAIDPDTQVLVSDVLTYTSEYRIHVLDGQVHTASQYAQDGQLKLQPASHDATDFASELLTNINTTIPSAIVIDVGSDTNGQWSVIEANAAWASGCYLADPDRVLDVVLRGAGPVSHLAAQDQAFVRDSGATT